LPVPGWFAEEGWSLTPETAGIARLMGRGPSRAPITGWIRRRAEALDLLVGGRHLGRAGDAPVHFALAIEGRDVATWESQPGFFLNQFQIPAGTVAGDGLAAFTIRAISGQGGSAETAIEQFNAQSAGSLMWGYDEGWHEAESNAALGLFRWTSDEATLRIINASRPVAITITVESPERYFGSAPTVEMRAGDRVLAQTTFAHSTVWRVVVPVDALQSAGGRVTLATNQTFVPADTSGVADRRRLGLRVFDVSITFEH
jgi:hypothetical protein